MKKTLPITVYRYGLRYVVGEAKVEVDENMEIDWKKAEINITHPMVTEMLSDHSDRVGFSIGNPAGQ
jgi:hypothetical protein